MNFTGVVTTQKQRKTWVGQAAPPGYVRGKKLFRMSKNKLFRLSY